jgi:large-conductance mechanosensitive channel
MAAESDSENKTKTVRTDASSSRGQHRRASAIKIARKVNPVSGFVDFLRSHAIVGLAIGFVLGTQVQTVVKQIISSFINPLFVLIFPGNQTLSARTFTLHLDGRHADFGWGAVVFTIIDFVFIAIVIYAIIKLFKLDKLDKPTI